MRSSKRRRQRPQSATRVRPSSASASAALPSATGRERALAKNQEWFGRLRLDRPKSAGVGTARAKQRRRSHAAHADEHDAALGLRNPSALIKRLRRVRNDIVGIYAELGEVAVSTAEAAARDAAIEARERRQAHRVEDRYVLLEPTDAGTDKESPTSCRINRLRPRSPISKIFSAGAGEAVDDDARLLELEQELESKDEAPKAVPETSTATQGAEAREREERNESKEAKLDSLATLETGTSKENIVGRWSTSVVKHDLQLIQLAKTADQPYSGPVSSSKRPWCLHRACHHQDQVLSASRKWLHHVHLPQRLCSPDR